MPEKLNLGTSKTIPMKKPLLIIFLLGLVFSLNAQSNSIIVPSNVRLMKDSILRDKLISSLNGLLLQKDLRNEDNQYILPDKLLETSIFVDELKNIENSRKYKDTNFYKCYLNNVVRLNDSLFDVQLSFMSVIDSMPYLRASFSMKAVARKNQFYFYSMLSENTQLWRSKSDGQYTVYYESEAALRKAMKYLTIRGKFDQKLGITELPTTLYWAQSFKDALQLIGVNYKSNFNGRNAGSLYTYNDNRTIIVRGAPASDTLGFDPHDLWHSRLRKVLPRNQTNRPVDEGCAYLYGGSWGYEWKDILEKFKAFADEHPTADWLSYYNESKDYSTDPSKPLNVDFTINALLVQKIEATYGFEAVFKLLSCGKKTPDNENYFHALEEITGITKPNFNREIKKMIRHIPK